VVLSRATVADGREIVRGNLESRGHHRPWVEPFTDQAGFEAWLNRTLTGPNLGLVAREAAAAGDGGGGVVGIVNLNEIVAGAFQSAYLGYWVMARFAGRGLMTEALALACGHAFRDLGLHRVEANIQPANARSIALVRRLGFRMEGFSPRYLRVAGQWRDHERWALLADDPAAAGLA
jgi:ribosomal-protein-alanine N-acetyltransferase